MQWIITYINSNLVWLMVILIIFHIIIWIWIYKHVWKIKFKIIINNKWKDSDCSIWPSDNIFDYMDFIDENSDSCVDSDSDCSWDSWWDD